MASSIRGAAVYAASVARKGVTPVAAAAAAAAGAAVRAYQYSATADLLRAPRYRGVVAATHPAIAAAAAAAAVSSASAASPRRQISSLPSNGASSGRDEIARLRGIAEVVEREIGSLPQGFESTLKDAEADPAKFLLIARQSLIAHIFHSLPIRSGDVNCIAMLKRMIEAIDPELGRQPVRENGFRADRSWTKVDPSARFVKIKKFAWKSEIGIINDILNKHEVDSGEFWMTERGMGSGDFAVTFLENGLAIPLRLNGTDINALNVYEARMMQCIVGWDQAFVHFDRGKLADPIHFEPDDKVKLHLVVANRVLTVVSPSEAKEFFVNLGQSRQHGKFCAVCSAYLGVLDISKGQLELDSKEKTEFGEWKTYRYTGDDRRGDIFNSRVNFVSPDGMIAGLEEMGFSVKIVKTAPHLMASGARVQQMIFIVEPK